MKICWDNLNEMDYNSVEGYWIWKGYKYVYSETKCPGCNEPYLHRIDRKNKHCSNSCVTNLYRLTYEYVKDSIEKEGYKLISKKYKNYRTKLELKCPRDHLYITSWGIWYRGHRCSECSGNKKKTIEEVRASFEKEGYELLSKRYMGWNKKLKYKCPIGHINYMIWNNWNSKNERCPMCSYMDGKSSYEKDIIRFIKSQINYKIMENDRTLITNPLTGRNLELDIWIPTLNKAIEFNGDYWHSKKSVKVRDQIKKEQCKVKNIDFLVITEDKWKKEVDKMKDTIIKFLKGENN